MSKINSNNFKAGISKSVYSGRHQKEGNLTMSIKNKNNLSKNSKISEEILENGVFSQNNPDRRGKKSSLEFRGHMPVRWNPTIDYNNEISGYTEKGGAFSGGSDGIKAGNKKDYSKPYSGVDSKNITPHKVRLNKKVVKLK